MIGSKIRSVACLVAASSCYGFALGSAHSWLYAQRNLIKFPLLILGTGLVCSLAYFVTARFLGVELAFKKIQRLVLELFRDASVLLVSLSPATFFVARALAATDDSKLGEYGMFLGLNLGLVALCSILALAQQAQRLLAEAKISIARSSTVILVWLLLSLMIGGQGAFWLRPFFGLPATRGQESPFAQGSTPDVRGATNFYEAVWQIIEAPPLPREWR